METGAHSCYQRTLEAILSQDVRRQRGLVLVTLAYNHPHGDVGAARRQHAQAEKVVGLEVAQADDAVVHAGQWTAPNLHTRWLLGATTTYMGGERARSGASAGGARRGPRAPFSFI